MDCKILIISLIILFLFSCERYENNELSSSSFNCDVKAHEQEPNYSFDPRLIGTWVFSGAVDPKNTLDTKTLNEYGEYPKYYPTFTITKNGYVKDFNAVINSCGWKIETYISEGGQQLLKPKFPLCTRMGGPKSLMNWEKQYIMAKGHSTCYKITTSQFSIQYHIDDENMGVMHFSKIE